MPSKVTKQEHFKRKLKNPYYDRPIVVKDDAPVGAMLTVMVQNCGVVFTACLAEQKVWYVWGDDTDSTLDYLTSRQLEERILSYWRGATKDKNVYLDDPGCHVLLPGSINVIA